VVVGDPVRRLAGDKEVRSKRGEVVVMMLKPRRLFVGGGRLFSETEVFLWWW
jgi:hypothetical protein